MKFITNNIKSRLTLAATFMGCLLMLNGTVFAQVDSTAVIQDDSTAVSEEPTGPVKIKPAKNTFESAWLIDNQTVIVPVQGALEMDIMHRFGTVTKGYQDFWGFFAPSNIRLGLNYVPIKNLSVGFGVTKSNMLWDGNAKYAIITQTKNKYPVSVSFYTNMSVDTRKDADKSLFKYSSQRYSFFNQVLIARKITEKLSLQVAPSISHQNSVNGYYTKNDSTGKELFKEMKFDHFAIAFSGRYKLTQITSLMLNYDQPITKHATNNPDPNLSFGVEFNLANHAFQLFVGNYGYLSPQRNNLFNQNSPFGFDDLTKTHANRKTDNPNTTKDESVQVKGGQFVVGFNITRLWNY